MITRIIFLLCFVTLLQPVWDLPLPRPDGKNLIFLLIIHLQFFSALLSVFLFIYSNSKIAFKLLVVFLFFFFSRTSRTLRPSRGRNCCNDKNGVPLAILTSLEKDVFGSHFLLSLSSLGLRASNGP